MDDKPDTEEQEAGHGRVIGIDVNAMEALEAYRWTGNVRAAEVQSATRWPSSATAAFQPSSVVIASRSAAAAAASPCTM